MRQDLDYAQKNDFGLAAHVMIRLVKPLFFWHPVNTGCFFI